MDKDSQRPAETRPGFPPPADAEVLRIRVHGDPTLPVLIYLPGLHGDWTLVGGFRKALEGRVRFVEFTYPRTTTWSLEEYAAAIEAALAEQSIAHGWVVAESFGSQVAWPLVQRANFKVDSLVLAGGFVRHPVRAGVWLAERLTGRVSLRLVTAILFGYSKVAKWRFRHSPEVVRGLDEFIARRTELDRQAATARLRLLTIYDPAPIVRCLNVPLYSMTGLFDPIVPWFFVRRWLQRNCPSLREYRIIARADHTVLATAPREAAIQVLQWMGVSDQGVLS